MKTTLLFLALLLFAGSDAAAQHKPYKGTIRVTSVQLQQENDSLHVKLLFDLSDAMVKPQQSVSLIPVIATTKEQLELIPVEVKGRRNFNVHQRVVALMSTKGRANYEAAKPYEIVRGYGEKKDRLVKYEQTIRFEPWMADASLELFEDLCGCGRPPRRIAGGVLAERIAPPAEKVLLPALAYAFPEPKNRVQRVEFDNALLDFVVNHTSIRPDYRDNALLLRQIEKLMAEINDQPGVKVNAVSVTGYASPEGPQAHNQHLSEQRAQALANYLTERMEFLRPLCTVVGGGENWDDLYKLVEASEMPYKQDVLRIIETVPAEIDYRTDSSRKKSLMMLAGGDPYRFMMREFFPSLRTAVCRIDYTVNGENFDPVLTELFKRAAACEKGSPEFLELFVNAARDFNNDPVVNLNAALAWLARQNVPAAEAYLDRIPQGWTSPEYDNARGALLAMKGDTEGAAVYFTQAAEAGLPEAQANLEKFAAKHSKRSE